MVKFKRILQMFLHLRCAVLEKGGELPLSQLSLSKGSWTAFPLWRVCTVKKGQSKTLQGQSVCSEWPPVCHSVSPHTAGHWCHSPLHSAHLSSSAIKAGGTGNAQPRAGFGPQVVKIQPFPKCQMGWALPNTGHALGSLGRVWQCWAPVLGSPCTCVGHTGTALLKEKGELNKAQFPEIWTDKEGCVSLEINFHHKAPPNDWQLHPRT